MNIFKELSLTDKGFVKPGIYLSEFGNLIVFYPDKSEEQVQYYYHINNKWEYVKQDLYSISIIQKCFDYEWVSDL